VGQQGTIPVLHLVARIQGNPTIRKKGWREQGIFVLHPRESLAGKKALVFRGGPNDRGGGGGGVNMDTTCHTCAGSNLTEGGFELDGFDPIKCQILRK